MLTLTADAATEIRSLIERPDIPDSGGVRIANDPAAGNLTLTLAAVPGEDDQVLDEAGARLFLDPQAAELLDDKTLDIAADAEGQVQFAVGPQGV